MDMFNIDLSLQNQYDDRRKPKKKEPTTKTTKKSKTVTEDDFIDDDAAFHFMAFVPIEGEVWKLDGLNRQPERLGK